MKKLIGILTILLFIMFAGNAQESATQDYDMGYNKTWLAKDLRLVDSIGETDSIFYYTVRKLTTHKVFPSYRIVLDKIDGTPADVAVKFKHKRWINDPWTTQSTVTYAGTVDTAINYTGTSVIANYFQIHVKCATDEFHVVIDSVYFLMPYD